MAVVKRFFFDGEEIREEITKKTEKKPESKKLENKTLGVFFEHNLKTESPNHTTGK